MEKYVLTAMGTNESGCTSLGLCFTKNPNPGEENVRHAQVDELACRIEVVHTVGQELYIALRDGYMRSCEGFLLVYNPADRRSFEHVYVLHESILRVKDCDKFPMILVCCTDSTQEGQSMGISREEGQACAKSFGIPFFETSRRESAEVDELFFELVREVRKHKCLQKQLEPELKMKKKKRVKRTCILS